MKEELKQESKNGKIHRKTVKSRAVRYFGGFMVFMLVCTAVSRGIYAYQLPQVIQGKAERKTITHKIEAEGIIEAAAEKPVTAPEGIRVEEICVTTGESVEEGSVLFYLELADVTQISQRIGNELAVEKLKLSDLERNQRAQQEKERLAVKRAAEDMASAQASQNTALTKIQKEYVEAYQERLEYPAFEKYLAEAQKKSYEYQSLKNAAGKEEATQADWEAYSLFAATFSLSVKEEWSDKKEALDKAVTEKEAALISAGYTIDKALKEAARELEDAQINTVQANSEILSLSYSIAAKEKELEQYQKLLENEGAVISKMSGTVQKINTAPGERTADGAALMLADAGKGWYFRAVLTEEEKKFINAGDMVTLSFQNGSIRQKDVKVDTIYRNEAGGYELLARLSDDRLVSGESGNLEFIADSNLQECCVPLTALYGSGNETYVLIIRENNTFLGTEYSVEKRIVVVADKNGEYAALQDAPLSQEDRIVIRTDRKIKPGDKVRMMEEDE